LLLDHGNIMAITLLPYHGDYDCDMNKTYHMGE